MGKDVPQILNNDLAVELSVAKALRTAIAECEQLQDYVTCDMLVQLLDDTEEDHAQWLEQQLGLIHRLGLANYLQSQMVSPAGG